MAFIDVLPLNQDGRIIFSPAGETQDGEYIDGSVGVEWLKNVYPAIATSVLPMPRATYDAMKAIDRFWLMNAAQWRKNGVMAVVGLKATDLLDDEEALLNPPVEETPEETPEQPIEGE